MIKRNHNLTKTERYTILKKAKWRCAICGIKLKYSKQHQFGEVVAHMDHIHPVSKAESYPGYIHELKNFQVLCPRCNLMKGNKMKRCPECKKDLEIGIFNVSEEWKDFNPDDIEKVYICNFCGTFFAGYEIDGWEEYEKQTKQIYTNIILPNMR